MSKDSAPAWAIIGAGLSSQAPQPVMEKERKYVMILGDRIGRSLRRSSMEDRMREALEDDIDRWERHLDWLYRNPGEPDRKAQITETQALIEENRRLLAA
jgi:hypothetical protein